MQTEYWRDDILNNFPDKIDFPMCIFEDAFETGNPLGSHAGIHKVNAVRTVVACLSPQYSSKLSSIFRTQLYYVSDSKDVSKKVIFSKLIVKINKL